MAFALSKQRYYKYFAETYSKVNAFQVELGKQLINFLVVNVEIKYWTWVVALEK